MATVALPIGSVDYRVFGPDTPGVRTVVFVHGFLVNGHLWDGVAERLAQDGVRSIVPDWPLGAHRTPASDAAELSPVSVAASVLALLDALDLEDVTLVGNDTGGAICQLALRGDHRRVGRLVLTNCDAFEHFPPTFFVPLFVAARSRVVLWAVLQTTRLRALRHSPAAFGFLLTKPRNAALTRRWVQPALESAAIRRDITRFAKGVRRDELLDAASWLGTFDKPTRLVWGTRDRLFTPAMAKRLRTAFAKAELIDVEGATTFVSIDRPGAVADAILEMP